MNAGTVARPWGRRLFLFLLYTYGAALVLVFLLIRGISTYSWATVPALVDGTAYRPFVTRAFLPAIVRWIVRATPQVAAQVTARVGHAAAAASAGQRMDRALAALGWTPADTYVHLVATFVMFLCFAALPWIYRRLSRFYYPDLPGAGHDLAPFVGMLALPLFFIPYARYLYDPGTIVLWALALLLVTERRHVATWLLLPVLAWHKETAVLLPPLVALREWRESPRSRTVATLVAQLALVAAIRWLVGRQFAGNPGGIVLLVGPGHTRELFKAALRRPPYVLAVVAMLWALAQAGWAGKPWFLRRGLVLVVAPLALLSLAFGYVDEIRGYYEAYAILYLLAIPTVSGMLRAQGPTGRPLATAQP